VLGLCCLLAAAGLFGVVGRQSWTSNAAATEVVQLEAKGAEYLHPLTTLLAEMVEAQSVAVRGEQVDVPGLRDTLGEIADLDRRFGGDLQTSQRLADLGRQVDAVAAQNPVGRQAFDTYSGLVTLTVDLIRRVGDTAHLVRDPDLDTYYLMDAAIVRLPDAMVLAGRAADLVELAGGGTLKGEDAIRAAVARFGVSTAAELVNSGLSTSVDVTERSELSSRITERLDAFKAAADAFAPPTMLVELSGSINSETVSANARRVYAAANPLAHRLIGELQVLLAQREDDLAAERLLTLVASGLAGLVLLAIGWVLVSRRWSGAPAAVPPAVSRPPLAASRRNTANGAGPASAAPDPAAYSGARAPGGGKRTTAELRPRSDDAR
jgi:hypothetical protein